MRYELTYYEWDAIKPLTAQCATGERPARAQRHLLRPAFGCAVARPAGQLWMRYEAGKGDHRHIGETEKRYNFTTPEALLTDF